MKWTDAIVLVAFLAMAALVGIQYLSCITRGCVF